MLATRVFTRVAGPPAGVHPRTAGHGGATVRAAADAPDPGPRPSARLELLGDDGKGEQGDALVRQRVPRDRGPRRYSRRPVARLRPVGGSADLAAAWTRARSSRAVPGG